MIFPIPELHGNWQSWAMRLISVLNEPQSTSDQPVELPKYIFANLPKADPDGMLVWCTDCKGGPGILYSQGGKWFKISGTQAEQGIVVYVGELQYSYTINPPTVI